MDYCNIEWFALEMNVLDVLESPIASFEGTAPNFSTYKTTVCPLVGTL